MAKPARGLAEKHAVVTGGSRGIGLGIAHALAQLGARVSIVSRVPTPPDNDGEFFRASADVANEGQVKAALAACRQEHGPIAILINNAGIAESTPVTRTSLRLWQRTLATNLTGTFLCTRAVLDEMQLAAWGRVVNIASTAGLFGVPYVAAYCASKHGVVGFSRAVAAEFDGTGVTINAVCPGYTDTEMMQSALNNVAKYAGVDQAAARARLARSNPQGRIASVEEVAAAALELVAGSQNGAVLVVPR